MWFDIKKGQDDCMTTVFIAIIHSSVTLFEDLGLQTHTEGMQVNLTPPGGWEE